MQEITTNYADMFRQNVRCKGIIKNVAKGITIKLETKDYVTKEEFFVNFLKGFRSSYDMYPDEYNQKEYRRLLKSRLEEKKTELEELEFAYKVCGRKILGDEEEWTM